MEIVDIVFSFFTSFHKYGFPQTCQQKMMRVSVAINLVLTVTVFNDYLKNLAQAQAQWVSL